MNKLYNDTTVQAIANAIRAKNGSSDTYTIAEMSTALNDLSYYAKPAISNVPLATFEADGLPLNSLKASIVAKQAGSGTPSPENVRPISGWSEANVSDVGKNLFDKDNAGILTGQALNSQTGLTYLTSAWSVSNYIEIEPSTTYTLMPSNNSSVAFYDSEKAYISGDSAFGTKTTPSNAKYLRFDYKTEYLAIMQLELGSTATEYVPYVEPNLYTIAFGQTVYGGEVDVVNGELKITDGYIASYNGETLPSTWISDRDVYAEGTTPTTGAEVVYTLASPTTVSLTPTLIKSLEGINNLSVDTGEVIELEYFKEV